LLFEDGYIFSSQIESKSIPLLTSSIPISLRFGDTPGSIVNRSQANQLDTNGKATVVGLQVRPGRTLALVGGEVRLEGGELSTAAGTIDLSNVGASLVGQGNSEQNIQDSGGSVEIGAVGSNAQVNFFQSPQNNQMLTFDYSLGNNFQDITLSQLAVIDASGNGGGAIQLHGRNITLREGALIKSNTLGDNSGEPIEIYVTESLKVLGNTLINNLVDPRLSAAGIIIPRKTSISTTSFSKGRAGNINIKGNKLIVDSGAEIAAFSFGNGRGGDIHIYTTDSLEIIGQSIPLGFVPEKFFPFGFDVPGFGGAVFRAAASSSSVSASSAGPGDAGNIVIDTNRLSIRDGAFVSTNPLFSGDGGTITINASDSVEVSGTSKFSIQPNNLDISGSLLWTAATGTGDAKSLTINTQRLIIRNGGSVQSTTFADGKAGNVFINASKSVEVSGVGFSPSYGELSSTLRASSFGSGNAGDLNISTDNLVIEGGANISVAAIGRNTGQAGNLIINANSLSLNQGFITAETGKSGTEEGARIILQIRDILRLENESLISATANGEANGGNIDIDSIAVLAFPSTGPNGSDIIAKAERGNGGKIKINAQGIFGIAGRPALSENQTNDIDTSSLSGSSGQIQISTTTDPNQGLIELPVTVVDPNYLVAQNPCRRSTSSQFTLSGRGGLPSSVNEDLNGEAIQVGLVESTTTHSAPSKDKQASKELSVIPLSSSQIVPAQGWIYNDKGEVVLVAYKPAITDPQRLQSTPPGCPVL
jgi:large exoprotein involved in heme utilization and adhesion